MLLAATMLALLGAGSTSFSIAYTLFPLNAVLKFF